MSHGVFLLAYCERCWLRAVCQCSGCVLLCIDVVIVQWCCGGDGCVAAAWDDERVA
jgi:hypothetical protein